jgi:hypothetical protein
VDEVENFKASILRIVNEALTGLAKTGAKATARAVDSVLEDVADRADEFVERVKKGRTIAQKHGARPAKQVKVDARVVDAVEEDENT